MLNISNTKSGVERFVPAFRSATHCRFHLARIWRTNNLAGMLRDEFNFAVTPPRVTTERDEIPTDSRGRQTRKWSQYALGKVRWSAWRDFFVKFACICFRNCKEEAIYCVLVSGFGTRLFLDWLGSFCFPSRRLALWLFHFSIVWVFLYNEKATFTNGNEGRLLRILRNAGKFAFSEFDLTSGLFVTHSKPHSCASRLVPIFQNSTTNRPFFSKSLNVFHVSSQSGTFTFAN